MITIKDINFNKNKDENFNICEKDKSIIILEETQYNTLNASILTKSFSCSDLSSLNNLCYDGDNELSITVKKNNINYNKKYNRYSRYKSKSCENFLREVKHLPHVLYNKFLKDLCKKIEVIRNYSIRKENIFCNCLKINKKLKNKENT